MDLQVKGKLKIKSDLQTFDSGFTKREVVVTTDDQYPQNIAVEFMKDKCALLDAYKVGQDVKISINLGGREWINPDGVAKYFNSITGWKIDKAAEAAKPFTPPTVLEQESDLPF